MTALPQEILDAWEQRDPACVLTTVSQSGTPNTIYVSCCGLVDDSRILICDAKFGKTLENIQNGQSTISFLFFAPGHAAYQLKGEIHYSTEGTTFEAGTAYAMEGMETRGIAEITITEAFKGSDQLL